MTFLRSEWSVILIMDAITKEMNDLKRSRIMYIARAALEYFVAITVGGSYLATLTSYLGISDSLTGIIASFISLGCIFQLFSVFLKRRKVKGIVTLFSVVNQLLFMLLYIIPLSGGEKQFKIAAFIVIIFSAYLIFNIISPLKNSWLITLIDPGSRGIFSSWNEIFSLIGGMIFTYAMGSLIDHYKALGQIETSFIICGITVFVLTILHTLTLLFTIEPEMDGDQSAPTKQNPFKEMAQALKNKTVIKLTVMFCLWYIAKDISIPFYSTYLIKELGFSLKLISIFGIVGSVVRIAFSTTMGKYADRTSFAKMMRLCLFVYGAGFLVFLFTVPANGIWMYTTYCVLSAIANAGLNSALGNVVFELVPHNERSNALAVTNSISGLIGFGTTLIASRLVENIQQNGNTFLGMNLYAQQVCSALSLVCVAVMIVYITTVIMPIKKQNA